MRDIKIRYVLKNKHINEIHYKWYYINQIENIGLHGLLDIENYEIISRDMYTGLKDKNGKEIYERDIMQFQYLHEPIIIKKGKVVFHNGGFKIKFQKCGYCYINNCNEIIGNIHENPELLK